MNAYTGICVVLLGVWAVICEWRGQTDKANNTLLWACFMLLMEIARNTAK